MSKKIMLPIPFRKEVFENYSDQIDHIKKIDALRCLSSFIIKEFDNFIESGQPIEEKNDMMVLPFFVYVFHPNKIDKILPQLHHIYIKVDGKEITISDYLGL